jgi:WD40 repeat protein
VSPPADPRVKERFLQVLELSPEERERDLVQLAEEDPELARQVRALLTAHGDAAAEELERLPRVLAGALNPVPGAAGQRLGDYELLEEIGSGAFGSVWRARQVSLDRIVALKVLRSGRLLSRHDPERLRAEAEAIARLDHPHIVPVYEVGEHEGLAYFTMKWIEGGTLAQRLDRAWPSRRAALLMTDVARAVHHAHQRGLLHRDLKPSNVLLDLEGRPFVADFGIAKRLEHGVAATTTQALAGTPAYMAPEQALGGELTVATDVWALGCLLYELLAGRPAFGGGPVSEVLLRVRESEPEALRSLAPHVPRDLETIVLHCLRKEGARRYPSADALADDLERWLGSEPIAARRTGSLERLLLFTRRSPLTATLIGVAAGLVLLLAVGATWASVELGARLRDSYLDTARATRLASRVGARASALDLLVRAATIRVDDDLRDEAIACLAMIDLARERTLERPGEGEGRILFDAAQERVALQDGDDLCVLSLDQDSERMCLEGVSTAGFVRWSPDGRWLLARLDTGSGPASTAVWDMSRGEVATTLPGLVQARAADFAPDGRTLALGTTDGELVLVELPSGRELVRRPPESEDQRVSALAFAPDGAQLVAIVTADEAEDRLCLLQTETLAVRSELELPYTGFHACFMGAGDRLAVAGGDFRIHVHSVPDLEPLFECQGHAAEVVEVFASPEAPLLLSNSWDETARVWDAADGTEIRRFSARALGFTRDGKGLASADDSEVSLWRVTDDRVWRRVALHTGKSPRKLAFAPDGRRIASAGPDGLYLWGRDEGAGRVQVLTSDVDDLCFLDEHTLLACGGEGLLRIAIERASDPEVLLPGPLVSLAVASEGGLVAALARSALHLLDPRRPAEVRSVRGLSNLEFVSLSADGLRVAAGNWRGQGVRVWDLSTLDEPRVFVPTEMNVAAAISPDGRRLATASSRRFELWDVDTGERLLEVERWRAFGNSPAPVVFSPDGRLVAFGLASEVVRLIDTRTLATRATLEPPRPEAISRLAFSPEGSILGAACNTNAVHLWDLAELGHELAAMGLDGPLVGR